MESESDVISTDPSDYSDMESSLSDSDTSHHQLSSNTTNSTSHSIVGIRSPAFNPLNFPLPQPLNTKQSQIISIQPIGDAHFTQPQYNPMTNNSLPTYKAYKHEPNEKDTETSTNSHSHSNELKIKTEFNTQNMKFDRSELQKQSLDELLAKTLTFRPNLSWNEKNIFCRYCGISSVSLFHFPHFTNYDEKERERATHFIAVQWVYSVLFTTPCIKMEN